MIGLIATLTVRDGKGPDLEKIFADLAPKVRDNEPGNALYQLCRSKDDPNVYKVLELYTDQDALKAHGSSDHFKAAGASFAGVLAGAPKIEHLDAL